MRNIYLRKHSKYVPSLKNFFNYSLNIIVRNSAISIKFCVKIMKITYEFFITAFIILLI
jgi:hypothetical protein